MYLFSNYLFFFQYCLFFNSLSLVFQSIPTLTQFDDSGVVYKIVNYNLNGKILGYKLFLNMKIKKKKNRRNL